MLKKKNVLQVGIKTNFCFHYCTDNKLSSYHIDQRSALRNIKLIN